MSQLLTQPLPHVILELIRLICMLCGSSITADSVVEGCFSEWQPADTIGVSAGILEKSLKGFEKEKRRNQKKIFFLLNFSSIRDEAILTTTMKVVMFIQDTDTVFPYESSQVWLDVIKCHWMDLGVIHQKSIPFNKTICPHLSTLRRCH